MSQIISYKNISAIKIAMCNDLQVTMAPILKDLLNNNPEIASVINEHARVTPSIHMLAPYESSIIIQRDYDTIVSQKAITATNIKAAALSSICKSQNNLYLSTNSRDIVKTKLEKVVAATSLEDVRRATNEAFKAIKESHSNVFINNICTAIQESAVAIGFNQVRIDSGNGNTKRIIATNPEGKNLIAEVSNQKQINVRTELLGYVDESCQKVARMFHEEMELRGVTVESKKQQAKNRNIRVFNDEQITKETSNMTIKY